MKRILLVTDVYNWGGHVRAQYIKKHLSDEFSFDIMDGEEFTKYIDVINSTMINRDWAERMNEKYDIIYLLFHTMLLRKDVTTLLKRKEKKILTAVTSYPVLRAGFLNVEKSKAKKSMNMFLSRANNCVGVIANNYKSLEDLKSIYEGRTFYAPRGVDEKIFYPTKDEFIQKPENEFTVAFVGKEGSEKGLEDIIKPACQTANVKLISNQRNYTNALTPDEMREFYNQADVYVVASISEGTPNTALEAAACGLPLVSNHVGNMPDLIENHKNSWLIKERELHKYYNRLMWLKQNQKTAWEFGQRIREAVLKDWTWEKVLNKNERMIFREILKD